MRRYFYAGGERHELVLDDELLAVDSDVAASAGLANAVAGLQPVSKLGRGLLVVRRSAAGGDVVTRLQSAGAVRRVYRSGANLVVPTPEVRVELEPEQRAATLRALRESAVPAQIIGDEPGRLSLRPESGDADDALDLANHIYETVRPAAASVRMIQVVRRPDA